MWPQLHSRSPDIKVDIKLALKQVKNCQNTLVLCPTARPPPNCSLTLQSQFLKLHLDPNLPENPKTPPKCLQTLQLAACKLPVAKSALDRLPYLTQKSRVRLSLLGLTAKILSGIISEDEVMEGIEGSHAELPDFGSKYWAGVAAEDSALLIQLLDDCSPRESVSSNSSSGYVSSSDIGSSEDEVKVAEELSEAMEEDELGQKEAKEWVDVVAEDERLFNEIFEDRSLREYNSSTSDSTLGDLTPRDHSEDVTYPANVSSSSTRARLGRGMPKLGWRTSPQILQRRDRVSAPRSSQATLQRS
ncbi:hypothetical protein L596_000219 [Steinernema carpocapsae]|uniref:Uncharacterized protein n=1 Tax=Steinernema carpocapsae TaxID=34508 RepID=A0A4U8UHA0_STECR|nr:hypothetical protein L596_000219 [Steinernema carpocapsae]